MNLGRVVGTVVATRKDESLVGLKLLVAQPLDLQQRSEGAAKVMVDTVGAGVGELVLYVSGAAARHAAGRKDGAMDAAVVGIVDALEVDNQWIASAAGGTEGDECIE